MWLLADITATQEWWGTALQWYPPHTSGEDQLQWTGHRSETCDWCWENHPTCNACKIGLWLALGDESADYLPTHKSKFIVYSLISLFDLNLVYVYMP